MDLFDVASAEVWKQRVAKEAQYHAPRPDPGLIVLARRSGARLQIGSTAAAQQAIEKLEHELQDERRRREAIETELARRQQQTRPAYWTDLGEDHRFGGHAHNIDIPWNMKYRIH